MVMAPSSLRTCARVGVDNDLARRRRDDGGAALAADDDRSRVGRERERRDLAHGRATRSVARAYTCAAAARVRHEQSRENASTNTALARENLTTRSPLIALCIIARPRERVHVLQ